MTAILSIHSSVTAGFVGNSVVGPVLLSLGIQPLLVDTVMLSAHPGYGRRAGGAVPDELLKDVLTGVADLTDLRRIDAVISGYLGGAGQVSSHCRHDRHLAFKRRHALHSRPGAW